MKRLMIALAVASISACGALPEPSNYDQTWAETQTCTGLTASKPSASVIPDIFWDVAKDGNNGYYNYPTKEIMIKESEQRDRDLVAHEMVHHLIYVNYDSEDRNHTNELFAQCGYAS